MQVPPSAGGAPGRRADAGGGEPAPGEERDSDHHRYDCRCHHHSCAQLDQEPRAAEGSGDAPDEKGKDWYFGMKGHVGVDSKTKLIHSVVATPANVADSAVLPELLHGEETRVWGDGAYQGQSEVIHQCAPRARDCTQRRCRYKDRVDEVERARNRNKSRVRSKVEHVFGVMKLRFGFIKVRYRGLKKNANRLFAIPATG